MACQILILLFAAICQIPVLKLLFVVKNYVD